MCGLAGLFGDDPGTPSADVARRMGDAIAHRGPDDVGLCQLAGAGRLSSGAFTHRRLSILDLSPCGHQPMTASEGRFTLVFNGEIYNFRHLRSQLEASGARFRSDSDTEVILEGWAREGAAFLGRLRGMFALALWDEREGRAYLARDAFGIKPMYVAARGGRVLFASELRALLASGLVRPSLAPAAVVGFLAQGAVPEPLSAIEGVSALPPGTVTTVDVDRGRATLGECRPFASALSASDEPRIHDRRLASRRVRDALRESVGLHLVSDVPVALFLSGGIDSSAVVALASEFSGEPLQTFTVTFGERGFSEAAPASAVAKRFRTSHHEVPLSGDDLLASLPAALRAMDQPSLDGLNTFAVSDAVRRAGFKVVLSGLGGDEMFGGYPSFGRARRLASIWSTLGPLRAPLRGIARVATRWGGTGSSKLGMAVTGSDPAAAAYRASRALFAGKAISALTGQVGGNEAAPHTLPPPPGLSLLQRVSWYELTGYMRSTLLRDSDVFSMAHGLELRVPFVDAGVAAASMAVADQLKLDPRTPKPLIVGALDDLLPREVWDRPKRGFELPFREWMRRQLRADVEAVLHSPTRLERVGLRPAGVGNVWNDFLAQRNGVTWSRPWALFCLVRWAETVGASLSAPLDHSSLRDDRNLAEPVGVS